MGTLTQTRVRTFTCFRGLEYGLFSSLDLENYQVNIGNIYASSWNVVMRLDDEYIMYVQMNYA